MKIENGNMKIQNMKIQNMKIQNMKIQNMKMQNMKMQNMKFQNMKMQNMKIQNMKMQNMKIQNMKMQNMKIQNMKMFFVVSRLGHRTFGQSLSKITAVISWNVDHSKPDSHFDSQIDPYFSCKLIEYIYSKRQHKCQGENTGPGSSATPALWRRK